jgi:hypothetical protein
LIGIAYEDNNSSEGCLRNANVYDTSHGNPRDRRCLTRVEKANNQGHAGDTDTTTTRQAVDLKRDRYEPAIQPYGAEIIP